MPEVTDEMVTRAIDVIFTSPGLFYFGTPEAVAHNRDIVRRALIAALQPGLAKDEPSDEGKIREAMAEAMEHPGRIVTR